MHRAPLTVRTIATCLVFAASSLAQQAPKALSARVADYVEMPVTADLNLLDARTQPARINFLVEEPKLNRHFIGDCSGQLYILDKKTRQPVVYLDFDGSGDRKGLFQRFKVDGSFASGLLALTFDPDYTNNGIFYTIHLEDAASKSPAAPKLNTANYAPTKAIFTPSGPAPITREGVLVEWSDRNTKDAKFEGTAREIMRVQLLNGIHPMNDITFNPSARRGDSDWRVLYVSTGDGGTGELPDVRRLNPQRLDQFGGTIIRIVPDLREHVSTSEVSENGKYRIPKDNPFFSTPGARKEIWAHGMRNPHRMAWDVASQRQSNLLAFVIGSNMGDVRYETINVIRRGANYGYPLREGAEYKPDSPVFGPLAADKTLPVRISDTVVLEQRVTMADSALAYKTGVEGNAIANGFVYQGKKWKALQGSVVFADITSGRIFYAKMSDLITATDGKPATLAAFAEIKTDIPQLVLARAKTRMPAPPPENTARPQRPPRIDVRLATDSDGEIYITSKTDGVIRRIQSLE